MRDWTLHGPVTLRNFNTGEDTIYESAETFAKSFLNKYARSRIGDAASMNNVGPKGDEKWYDAHPCNYLLYDECGLIIPLWKVEEILSQFTTVCVSWKERIYGRYPYRYRYDPVPGVHKWKSSYWYKNPHTSAEKRSYAGLKADEDIRYYNIKLRHARSLHNLPEAYDERQRGDVRTRRGWKKTRKNQWK